MRKAAAKIRCAVYTRKSTEDGLEQEFNSLDAQRDACSAYVMSQMHEGWTLAPDAYDDGGFSGGTMERPGLKRLLADVAAGKIDVIVIYKIDRLTRSLTDFSKIVDVLDKANASFVSITQAFNTTTSMGRLTLNMLLSFAQFEREVTGERIRDKIAASKRKGLWMGGPVPLGYDVRDRKLVVNEKEADLVRHIMRRYVALSSLRELADELNRDGYKTKIQQRTSGPHKGGCVFRRGTLFYLLSNRTYLGEIVHKGEGFVGEHPAIVDQDLWDAVRAAMLERTSGSSKRRGEHPSLLATLLRDGLGRPMTPVHTSKAGRRFRYYYTRPDSLEDGPAWRVSAFDLERIVTVQIAAMLENGAQIYDLIQDHVTEAAELQAALQAAESMAARLRTGSMTERLGTFATIKPDVQLFEDHVAIEIKANSVIEAIGCSEVGDDAPALKLICHAVRVRRGHEIKLVIPGSEGVPRNDVRRDGRMVTLLVEAHAAKELVLASPQHSINRIATDAGRCRTRLAKLFALSHLAPSIATAIVEGKQPKTLTRQRLLEVDLPVDWAAQRAMLGFT